jgi:flavin-dependent dehydrogenase
LHNTRIVGAGSGGSYLPGSYLASHKVFVLEKKAAAGQDICCTGIAGSERTNLLDTDNNHLTRQAKLGKALKAGIVYTVYMRNLVVGRLSNCTIL